MDSSVLVRLVLGEPRPLAEWADITDGVVSGIARVEGIRTIDRHVRSGRVTARHAAPYRGTMLRLLGSLTSIAVDDAVLARASDPLPVPVRTLDAIHLATADVLRAQQPDLRVFATHDIELGHAALALGFTVIGV